MKFISAIFKKQQITDYLKAEVKRPLLQCFQYPPHLTSLPLYAVCVAHKMPILNRSMNWRFYRLKNKQELVFLNVLKYQHEEYELGEC